jgi:hypothetical protein
MPTKRPDKRRLNEGARSQPTLPVTAATELEARLQTITHENARALAALQDMKQLIAGVPDQQKLPALGPRRDEMITVLEAMRVQLAELMETIAQHVGQPLGVTRSPTDPGPTPVVDEQIARVVTRVVTIAQAIDEALAALRVSTGAGPARAGAADVFGRV